MSGPLCLHLLNKSQLPLVTAAITVTTFRICNSIRARYGPDRLHLFSACSFFAADKDWQHACNVVVPIAAGSLIDAFNS